MKIRHVNHRTGEDRIIEGPPMSDPTKADAYTEEDMRLARQGLAEAQANNSEWERSALEAVESLESAAEIAKAIGERLSNNKRLLSNLRRWLAASAAHDLVTRQSEREACERIVEEMCDDGWFPGSARSEFLRRLRKRAK